MALLGSSRRPTEAPPTDLAASPSIVWAWVCASVRGAICTSKDVLWCGRDLAEGTCLGCFTLFEPAGGLVPCSDVIGLARAKLFAGLVGNGPVDATNQGLAIPSAGKSVASLLSGLSCQASSMCRQGCLRSGFWRLPSKPMSSTQPLRWSSGWFAWKGLRIGCKKALASNGACGHLVTWNQWLSSA